MEANQQTNGSSFGTRVTFSEDANVRLRVVLVSLLMAGVIGGKLKAQDEEPRLDVIAEVNPVMSSDLVSASRNGNLEKIRQCVQAGNDLDEPDPIHGVTPLCWAAAIGHMEAVDLLLREGADVNARNRDGSSALHTACFFGHPRIVDRLLSEGADINSKTRDGATPLDAVEAEWEVTRSISNALQIEFFQERIAIGRSQAGDLLLQRGAKKGGNTMFVLTIVLVSVTGGLSIVGLIIWLVYLHEKKRTEVMKSVAAEIGLSFSASKDEGLFAKLKGFSLFNKGYGRKMKNVMKAETELAHLTIFDYQYTTGGGKHSHTHHHTVVAMESGSLRMPDFTLRPEGFFDKIGSSLGFQDIDFDSHPEFSRLFVLKGKNEEAVRQFFDAEMLEMFTQQKEATVDCGYGVFIYHRGGRKKPEEIRGFMEEGFGVYKAFEQRLKRSQLDTPE